MQKLKKILEPIVQFFFGETILLIFFVGLALFGLMARLGVISLVILAGVIIIVFFYKKVR